MVEKKTVIQTDRSKMPFAKMGLGPEAKPMDIAGEEEILKFCAEKGLERPRMETHNFLGDVCHKCYIERVMPKGNLAVIAKSVGTKGDDKASVMNRAYLKAKQYIDEQEKRTYT